MTDYVPYCYPTSCGRLELFARDYRAEGPALLLMHGLTRNSADFEPLAEVLAGRYRLIVPDQRGRGLSDHDPDPENYRPELYVADMFALLDSLGIERATLIGTSMGGLMAMVMGVSAPERIPAMVLNDVGPELAPGGLARISGYVGDAESFPDWSAAARKCETINRSAFPDFSPADWDAFARRTCRAGEDGSITFAYDPAIAQAFGTAEGVAPPDLWPLWQALGGKPVLVIRGASSDLLSAATVERMAELHPGPFTRVDVPRRGHAPLLDEPEALAAIEPFLAEHAR